MSKPKINAKILKELNKTWYRGEHCNFMPVRKKLKKINAAHDCILKGWLPDRPFMSKSHSILTLGSCFAVRIKKYLLQKGYNVDKFNVPRVRDSYVINFGSGMVNTFAIRQQFEWAYEDRKFEESLWHNSEVEVVKYLDSIKDITKKIFNESDIFIITLGLSEVWYNKTTKEVFWRAIPEDYFDHNIHGFRVSTVEENVENLNKVIEIIKKYRPQAKIIFTISPVTLFATFRDVSCITADCVSKSTLRVAVDSIMIKKPTNIFYWPSYELVKNFYEDPYQDDNRHIKDEVADKIMNLFGQYYLIK